MKLGERMKGTEGNDDYIVVGHCGMFWLGVKPLVAVLPHIESFGFGVRFRSISDQPLSDPAAHDMIWENLEFQKHEPTHASVSMISHTVKVGHLTQLSSPKAIHDKLIDEGVYTEVAKTVMENFHLQGDATWLDGDEIIKGFIAIMGEKITQAEKAIADHKAEHADVSIAVDGVTPQAQLDALKKKVEAQVEAFVEGQDKSPLADPKKKLH
jgi:hypothetical protein